jgi:methyl-accepting chemotaxis protein
VTAAAIEELVAASTESVEHLARGLSRVQAIGDQVHLLGNRATLIALNAVVTPGASRSDEVAEELKILAHEVRVATESTDEMSREIEREINAASQRMKGIRERVATRLEQIPALPPMEAAALPEDLLRLQGRVREMVQDATRKGERVSSAAERASRAAERFIRRLEEELREIEGLAIRLGAPAPPAPEAGGTERGAPPASRSGPLRLLETESGEAADEGREAGEPRSRDDREERS